MNRDARLKGLIVESWAVSWPMTLIMFLVFSIGLADVYVAGRISKEVQAAYGLASQIYFILSIVGFALTVGVVSVLSRLFTADRKEELHAAVDSTLTIAFVAGALFSLIGMAVSGPLIAWLNVPAVLKGYSRPLMQVYSLGIFFSYLLVSTNGIMRACGMIRRSLLTMAVVCVLNVLLNFLLAFHTPLGFKGIAIATVVSTAAGCLLNLAAVRPLLTGIFKFSRDAVRQIVQIGWPAGLLQVFWQLAAMVLLLIIAALPVHNIEIMAAFTNGLKIEAAIFLPAFAFNMANAVVVGNLLGKKRHDDAFSIGIVTALAGVGLVTVLTALVMLNARPIASLLSNNPVVIRECMRYIYIALLSEPVMAWAVILAGALNGAGDTKGVMRIVLFCVWLIRVPVGYWFGLRLGVGATAVWWAMNLSLLVQALLMSRRYFQRRWLHVHAQAGSAPVFTQV